MNNYLENSSMHGLKYISSKTPSTFQRMAWSAAVLIAMGSAGYFISQVFLRWRNSPVLMVLSPTTITITTIPFPALVICNANNARRSKVEKYFKSSRATQEDKEILKDICGLKESDEPERSNESNAITLEKAKKNALKLGQTCSEMIIACTWRNKKPCLDMIEPIITDEGHCCIFNRLNRDSIYTATEEQRRHSDKNIETTYWTPERGYLPTDDPDMLPWRATGSGTTNGLKLLLDVEQHEYYCSSQLSVGFKINAHNPIESPRVYAHSLLVSPGYENRLVVTPKVIMASDTIKSVAVNKRNCYFSNERKLAFFRLYTEANCLRECLANYTLATCGCVPSYMPTLEEMTLCRKMTLHCVKAAEEQMNEEETRLKTTFEDREKIIIIKYEKAKKKQIQHCNCIPSCNDIKHDVTVSNALLLSGDLAKRTKYIRKLYSNKTKRTFNETYFRENMASLEIYFDKMQFTPYDREVVFAFSDLIANTGGLLGLFLGFSILSLAEIVYFILLKVFCVKNYDSAVTSTPEENRLPIEPINNWERIKPISKQPNNGANQRHPQEDSYGRNLYTVKQHGTDYINDPSHYRLPFIK